MTRIFALTVLGKLVAIIVKPTSIMRVKVIAVCKEEKKKKGSLTFYEGRRRRDPSQHPLVTYPPFLAPFFLFPTPTICLGFRVYRLLAALRLCVCVCICVCILASFFFSAKKEILAKMK